MEHFTRGEDQNFSFLFKTLSFLISLHDNNCISFSGLMNQVPGPQAGAKDLSNAGMQVNLLSKQLIITLHQLEEKEKLLKNMESKMSSYQVTCALMYITHHQISM